MTTKTIASHSHKHSTSSSVEAAPAATTHPPAAGAAAPAAAVAQAAPLPLIYLTPPPANALIPPVPSSFVPKSGTTYRSVVPKKAELVALPLAVEDLRKFTSYLQVLGATAPPYEEILQTFDVANQWSSMRTSSSAWDVYSRDQEGICWGVMRPAMESLKSAFDLAAARDPSLPAKFPNLAALLGAKTSIAVRAASTKRLNKKAVAEGKPPIHGQVGKKRQKATNKEILAAASGNAPSGASQVSAPVAAPAVTPPVPATAPVTVASANGAPPAAAPVVVTNGATTGTTNGVGH